MMGKDPISWEEPSRNRSQDVKQREDLESLFLESKISAYEKIKCFPNYVQTTYLRKFITRLKIYENILNVHGSIVECGVLGGDGVFSWAHFTEIFEPYNHLRQVIAFDTFAGFPSISQNDRGGNFKDDSEHLKVGGLKSESLQHLERLSETFDANRPLNHIKKISFVSGDANNTIPEYVRDHPEFVCALLWLDFDVYEPTKVALREIVPRMPKGALIAFDELNHPLWQGETAAVMEELGLRNLRVNRFSFGSTACYAILD